MSNEPIVVDGLRKSFGEQRVLNGISLRVNPEETVAVLGRSGTGKSVLLRLLIGLHQPDAGSVSVLGKEIGKLDPHQLNEVRTKVGFLFQKAALYDSLTVEENVAFPLKRHRHSEAAKQQDRVSELLRRVGMEEHKHKLPSEISGGMQKRVGIARALALQPEILLLDEPTAGLDPITSEEIGQLILELRRENKIAAVIVTHDIAGTRKITDRFVLMNEGNAIVDGTYEELLHSRDEFVVRFLRHCNGEEKNHV